MSNLAYRQQKIQEKRKKTPWRQFVMEIASWQPVMFYKNKGLISRYPPERWIDNLVTPQGFEEIRDSLPFVIQEGDDFFKDLERLRHITPTPVLCHNYVR